MDAIRSFISQLTKNASKQPGWVPLVLLLYIYFLYIVPAGVNMLGYSLNEQASVFVLLAAFISYQIGDAVDKALFENYFRSPVSKQLRKDVNRIFEIKSGSYRVASNLLEAAGSYQRSRPQVLNEAAKFLRSLGVFCLLLAVFPSIGLHVFWPVYPTIRTVALILSIPLIWLAFQLKSKHLEGLYQAIIEMIARYPRLATKLSLYDLQTESDRLVRLLFWEGGLVASAMLNNNEAHRNDSRIHPAAPVKKANFS